MAKVQIKADLSKMIILFVAIKINLLRKIIYLLKSGENNKKNFKLYQPYYRVDHHRGIYINLDPDVRSRGR
jgi:hypothetical protein